MERSNYLNISSHGINKAAASISDDPYGIELDRLDIFDNSDKNPFMTDIIESKKSLIDDAKLMRKFLRLDEFALITEPKEKIVNKPNKGKQKKVRKHNVDDDDNDEIDDVNANENVATGNNEDEGKADEEMTDEEIQVDELEEVKKFLKKNIQQT